MLRPKHEIYDAYCVEVKKKLNLLNQTTDQTEQAKILKELGELDENYLREIHDASQVNKIFFSRHAKCATLNDKKFGLAPNAAADESALTAMQMTGNITRGFLADENKECMILFSPMTRATQTAGKLIPDGFAGSASPAAFLAEISEYPSGNLLSSESELNTAKSTGSVLYHVSSTMYGESYFNNLNEKLLTAQNEINKKLTNKIDFSLKLDIVDNTQKINMTNACIDEHADKNIWFIGHGKNIKNYFKSTFNIGDDLDYCDTRKVLRYNTNDHPNQYQYFIPPYVLNVNQKTGLIEASMLAPVLSIEFELRQYIADRREEHQESLRKAKIPLLKTLTSFIKEVADIDYSTKISAAEKLLTILENNRNHIKNDMGLNESEAKALSMDRLGTILARHGLGMDNLMGNPNRIKAQNYTNPPQTAGKRLSHTK